MRISVIGNGFIGGVLGRALARAGHDVTVGVRRPEGTAGAEGATVASIGDAIDAAEVVVLAVPGNAVSELTADHGAALAGKLVVDATNRMGAPVANARADLPADVRYARAFNTLGGEVMAEPVFADGPADMFFSAPEADRDTVEQLVADVGLHPIYLGADREDLVDALFRVWVALAMEQGRGRRLALRVQTAQVARMPVPFPTAAEVNLQPPDEEETRLNAAAVLRATRPARGNTDFQRLLIDATFAAMTGHHVDTATLPTIDAPTAASHMARRAEPFRMRMVHMMVLAALVLRPVPTEVATSVAEYSRELGIDDRLLATVQQFAGSDHALAAVDFERNGYTADWSPEQSAALHTTVRAGWDAADDDPALAARWHALADLPAGTLGRGVHDFYRARGFAVPGTPGSAPPLLAQHDWVHVLADYGTKVDAELEVFAFIARANDDPRGFSLLAMVVSLFETGYLQAGAGLFEAFPGQLSEAGMTTRIGDAMRRGALSHGADGEPDVDFMQVDWFRFAALPVAEARRRFGLVEKSDAAVAAGSCSPWGPGGISEAQLAAGRAAAAAQGVAYDCFGATV